MFEKEVRMYYEEVDVRTAYRAGFWIGVITTFVGTLVLFAGIGLYLH